MMRKTQSTESANIPVLSHGIVRLVTKDGRKSDLRADARKRE
jgi:hypothetical protein